MIPLSATEVKREISSDDIALPYGLCLMLTLPVLSTSGSFFPFFFFLFFFFEEEEEEGGGGGGVDFPEVAKDSARAPTLIQKARASPPILGRESALAGKNPGQTYPSSFQTRGSSPSPCTESRHCTSEGRRGGYRESTLGRCRWWCSLYRLD